VTGYEGMNLIPLDCTDDLVLFTLWNRGSMLRTVTLKDIIPDPFSLVRTVAHYQWGHIGVINDQGELVVDRGDGKALYFDFSTGKSH
jgi:hypothetical protein